MQTRLDTVVESTNGLWSSTISFFLTRWNSLTVLHPIPTMTSSGSLLQAKSKKNDGKANQKRLFHED